MFHKLRIPIGLLCLLSVAIVAYVGWVANRPAKMPSQQELQATLDRGISWLETNRDSVIASNNSALWWMIKDSVVLTGDARLREIMDAYLTKIHAYAYQGPFTLLFDPEAPVRMSLAFKEPLKDYQYYILYGLTCDDSQLVVDDVVQRHSHADMCGAFPLHLLEPACVSHQLMGALFVRKNGCGNVNKTSELIDKLQSMIAVRQSLDVRVDDGYLQRVMTLAATGGYDRIKPAWVKNIMAAQLPDGGWEDFKPWFPVNASSYAEISRDGIYILDRKSTFHATAQGIFLFSLLLNQRYPE